MIFELDVVSPLLDWAASSFDKTTVRLRDSIIQAGHSQVVKQVKFIIDQREQQLNSPNRRSYQNHKQNYTKLVYRTGNLAGLYFRYWILDILEIFILAQNINRNISKCCYKITPSV